MPSRVIEYEKKKLKEFMDFNSKYGNVLPNLEKLCLRYRLISRYVASSDSGMVPFIYGKDYFPDMAHD